MAGGAVNCGTCTACCRNHPGIFLYPESGENMAFFAGKTAPSFNPVSGKTHQRVLEKPDGSCIFLGEVGCSIYPDRPLICCGFDCIKAYLKFDRATHRRQIKAGFSDPAVVAAGRERAGR